MTSADRLETELQNAVTYIPGAEIRKAIEELIEVNKTASSEAITASMENYARTVEVYKWRDG